MNFLVTAPNAPPGRSSVFWEDGELHGPPDIIAAAKAVKTVRPTPDDGWEPTDWNDPQHARTILNAVMHEQFGAPVYFKEDGTEQPRPMIETGPTRAASTI